MKTLFTTLLIIIYLNVNAQSSQAAVMGGYRAFEVSASYTAENELIFGLAASITDAKLTEYRANRNDIYHNVHKFKGDITPAAFGLVGGKFDELSLIGKVGASYVDQTINGEPTKDFFLAVGFIVDYKLSRTIGLRGSFDSISGGLLGISYHFNN